MKVRISARASADLDTIAVWIAQDSLNQALSFTAALREACADLGEHSRAYAVLPGYEARGVHRRPFGDYLIFYRVEPTLVHVIRIIHGARNYQDLI
jgi:toxin ParE1/3/4